MQNKADRGVIGLVGGGTGINNVAVNITGGTITGTTYGIEATNFHKGNVTN